VAAFFPLAEAVRAAGGKNVAVRDLTPPAPNRTISNSPPIRSTRSVPLISSS